MQISNRESAVTGGVGSASNVRHVDRSYGLRKFILKCGFSIVHLTKCYSNRTFGSYRSVIALELHWNCSESALRKVR